MTDRLARALDDLRRRYVSDWRLGVFEVAPSSGTLAGRTTSREALVELRRLGEEAGLAVQVTLLPDGSVDDGCRAAVVHAAVAPLLGQPAINAPRVTEALHGEPLDVLERRADWMRVRAGDGYVAWTHAGYLTPGSAEWLSDWVGRASARSLGVELEHEGQSLRLPFGARLAPRRDGFFETADGRLARVAHGTVESADALVVESRRLAPAALALRWFGGAPYLWGGRTEWGLDCSGLSQAVFGARGIALPRDSDQQFAVGDEVRPSPTGVGYAIADLLFFAEERRMSHVALWAGGGRIVHATLSRGGVVSEDLFGNSPRLQRLRDMLVGVRRVER